MNIEQERADFEMWCHTRSLDIGRDDNGDYISLETYLSWEGYQAGRAALQSQTAPGWKEAFKAWNVCASIHREWAKGKDAVFTTRQADFVRHAEDAFKKSMGEAALQSQDRDDALVQAIKEAIDLLGPHAPDCSGCEYEWNHALRVLSEAIDHARRMEGEI